MLKKHYICHVKEVEEHIEVLKKIATCNGTFARTRSGAIDVTTRDIVEAGRRLFEIGEFKKEQEEGSVRLPSYYDFKTTSLFWRVKNGGSFVVMEGSTRSSKSYSIAQVLVEKAATIPNRIVNVYRKFLVDCRASAKKDFDEIALNFDCEIQDKVIKFPNGSVINFLGLDKSTKALSVKCTDAYLCEISQMSLEDYIQVANRCTGSIYADFNPDVMPNFWLYGMKDRVTLWNKSTYKDNPFLTREQIERIESMQEFDTRLWKIYGLGECVGEVDDFFNIGTFETLPTLMNWTKFMVIDPSGDGSDDFAICEVSYNLHEKQAYITFAHAEPSQPKAIDLLCNRYSTADFPIYIELNGIGRSVANELYRCGVKTRGFSSFGEKTSRIKMQIPFANTHLLIDKRFQSFHQKVNGWNEHSKHDDAPDSVAKACEILKSEYRRMITQK